MKLESTIYLPSFRFQLPEAEVKDHASDQYKFELYDQHISTYPITLTAHKEQVKTTWLSEIRKYASDVGKNIYDNLKQSVDVIFLLH